MNVPIRCPSTSLVLPVIASLASATTAWSCWQAPTQAAPAAPAAGANAPLQVLDEEDIAILVDDEDVQSRMQVLLDRVRGGMGADAGAMFTRIQGMDARGWPAPEIEKGAAFFGVGTEPVSPQTAAQLPILRGSGLVVSFVEPEGPAAKAGLAPFDVLARLGDQVLVNAEQFAVLVRSRKAGDVIDITYLRGGKEQQARITLEARDLPRLGPGGRREPGIDGAEFAVPDVLPMGMGAGGPSAGTQSRVIVMGRPAGRAGDRTVRSEHREVRTMTFKNEDCGITWVMDGLKPSFVVRDRAKDGAVAWEGSGPPDPAELATLRPELAEAVRRFVAEQDRLREAIPNAPLPPIPPPPAKAPAPAEARPGRPVD